MANDSGTPMAYPLAYFLTWTTYGSWLPGDERGWVDKPGEFMAPDRRRESAAQIRMTEPEASLDSQQRDVVEATISEHCRIRGWYLHVAHCRTQHVHVVVTAAEHDPDDVLNQLKAWCTRRLKERQRAALKAEALGAAVREKWWTQGGSRRRLYDEDSLAAAIRYVREDQDRPR